MKRTLAVALILAALPAAARAELGVNLYGLSYHFNRARAEELGLDNPINPGLGLRYRVPHSEHMAWIADVGVYRDSGRNSALLAGVGALWQVTEGWRVGGALVGFKSDSYNEGKAFIAPVPLAAFETRAVTFNFAYVPKVTGVNDVATLGFWATWWIR